MHRIYKLKSGVLFEVNKKFYLEEGIKDWNDFINNDDLFHSVIRIVAGAKEVENGLQLIDEEVLPPIDKQEIWASGVTYFRSREARKEEAETTEGENFYEKVYDAVRPELFFKASAQRTVGTNDKVNIRKDSIWNVPEPELTLFVTSNSSIVGYSIGNDMSSRSIEGENPLYLPQAKVYERCAALGPCIAVSNKPIDSETRILMKIVREQSLVYEESVSINQMKRKHQDLVNFLFKECEFPYGCFLMTGTGMVPPKEFTLKSGDEISISIDSIGTLVNTVN